MVGSFLQGRRGLGGNRQKEETLSVLRPRKRTRTNLKRGEWGYGLAKLSRTHNAIEVLLLFLGIFSRITQLFLIT